MKKAIIVTVGDELLQGFTVDTNSSWISSYLRKSNINVCKKITIGDDENQILLLLSEIFKKEEIDFLIMTGGLGPTHDDITKDVLKKYFDCDYLIDYEYLDDLKEKYIKRNMAVPNNVKSQATYLSNSSPIINKYGSALGLKIKFNNKLIFVLPGVPLEMKQMLKDCVDFKSANKDSMYYTLRTTGIYESYLYDILKNVIKNNNDFKVAFLPKYSGVDVRLSKKLAVSHKRFEKFKKEIFNLIEKYVYSDSNEKIEKIVGLDLEKKNITISLAESCTGGLISKKMTDFPGATNYFVGGVVAYSNNIKCEILNVKNETIKKYGAVSQQTALEMALGVKDVCSSDIGLATTGISGPSGGCKEKPVGLVYIAIVYKNNKIVRKFNLGSNREINREITASIAFSMIRIIVNKNKI